WRKRQLWQAIGFMLIWLVFTYTTIDNIIERPDGLKIASFFIFLTIVGSLASRWWRSTELRVERFEIDAAAMDFINRAGGRTIRFIANQPDTRDAEEYRIEGAQKRIDHHLTPDEPVIFLEVDISDASNFTDVMKVEGCEVAGHQVLRAQGPAISNSIAAFLLHVRDVTGKLPHIYFNWSEQHPALLLLNYVVLGQGHVAQMTREVLRQAEPDCTKRPVVHVGG
ncbi:MAG: amino acid transporter, partial [Burkholderiales bacterium]